MNRSSFLASSASIAALTGMADAARSVPGGTHLVERKADFDEAAFARLVGRPADVRVLVESVSWHPPLLNNVKNLLNGLQFGYGYAPGRIAAVLAAHGPSSALSYSDYVWKKYGIGEFFAYKSPTGAPIDSNVFLNPSAALSSSMDPDDPNGVYQNTALSTLMKRGLIVLTCHTAVEEQSRALVKAGKAPAGMDASHVAQDILTHLIPGAHVVPSMMAAIAVLQQRFHYAYITVDFA